MLLKSDVHSSLSDFIIYFELDEVCLVHDCMIVILNTPYILAYAQSMNKFFIYKNCLGYNFIYSESPHTSKENTFSHLAAPFVSINYISPESLLGYDVPTSFKKAVLFNLDKF